MPLIVRFSQSKERAYDARIARTPDELGTVLQSFAGTSVWVRGPLMLRRSPNG